MHLSKTLTATAVAFGLTFGAGFAPVVAQDATEAPEAAATFSEEKLDSFVMAALDVAEIQQRAAATLGSVSDQAEQGKIIEDANADVVDAIEATPGITVDEYVAITEAAEMDPELSSVLQEKFTAAQDG